MASLEDICLIGVDGGGTSCRFALVWRGQRHEVTLGAANANTDRVGALAVVYQGLAQIAALAGRDAWAAGPCQIHLALAGILTDKDAGAFAQQLERELDQNPGQIRITVSDDRLAAVTGALGAGNGVLAGIGTGSFLARQHAGQVRFIGGWGLALGDEASGAWLGRGALSATLRVVDGLSPATGLTDDILAQFGTSADIVAFATTASPGDFARLASGIPTVALNGDQIAQTLMQAGAAYIETGLRTLGWQGHDPVCLTGGLGPSYAPWLAADLSRALTAAKGSALDGALHLAAQPEGQV